MVRETDRHTFIVLLFYMRVSVSDCMRTLLLFNVELKWIFYLTGLLLCTLLICIYLQHATSNSGIKPMPFSLYVGKLCRRMENSNMH